MSAHAYTSSRTAAQLSFFSWAFRRRARAPRLDLDTLPDHLKRDLGFLTGPDPSPRRRVRE